MSEIVFQNIKRRVNNFECILQLVPQFSSMYIAKYSDVSTACQSFQTLSISLGRD